MREMSGSPAARGIFITWRSTPSMRYRTATPPSSGSMCTSLARELIPSERIRSTSRTTGRWEASSAEMVRSSASTFSSSSVVICDSAVSIPSRSCSITFSGR